MKSHTMQSAAIKIFDQMNPTNYSTPRKFSNAVISRFIQELGMTKSCARTYIYNIRKLKKQQSNR